MSFRDYVPISDKTAQPFFSLFVDDATVHVPDENENFIHKGSKFSFSLDPCFRLFRLTHNREQEAPHEGQITLITKRYDQAFNDDLRACAHENV